MSHLSKRIRVLLTCTGIGTVNRGIESFFRETFDGLRDTPGLHLRLLKGAGPEGPDEFVGRILPRMQFLARLIGAITGRTGYAVEQWSSLFSVASHIRQFRPHVVFYSEANLGFLLWRFRRRIGVPYQLLFSNGGPTHPPFVRTDFVQQVAPVYYQEALRAGEPADKQFLVPYGINLLPPPQVIPPQERSALRRRIGLPPNRKIVLSIGWIRAAHKRMDYVIDEIERLPRPRPFLQLIGESDGGSREIIDRGNGLLGVEGFRARCVPYADMADYYRAADCFVLGSICEGFGRVYLEALMHGLPVVAHDNLVTRYVLGPHAALVDLTQPGKLAEALWRELEKSRDQSLMRHRWAAVRDRFSWQVLVGQYREMFQICAGVSGQCWEPAAVAPLAALYR
jgi:1,2-diacylglycerol 3-alpha-glucosyltransferase